MKVKARGPSAAVAQAAVKKRQLKNEQKKKSQDIEAKARANGGYGKAVVSVWEVPKGGIEKSPAYQMLLTRCELNAKGKPPPPAQRDGAPISGGYPLDKYPPNVIVDGQRVSWLPDNYAQVLKNTGPGGVYKGWMDPEGKFTYHRKNYTGSIEVKLGRPCTIQDGLNGLKRAVRKLVPPGADEKFLKECLTPAERKHLIPKEKFLFGVVSAFRADIESGQYDIMVVEGHFNQVGIKPTWYVDQGSLKAYQKLGLDAKVGGKLCPARNMVLNDAKRKGLVAVEVSDDISKWIYYDCPKQDYRGETDFKRQNKDVRGVPKHCVSPLAAAQWMVAKMRSHPDKPKLAGVYPTANAAMTLGGHEYGMEHFILGDFFVAEPDSPCRFDETMTLKEDYDYTCSHLKTHGAVLRCNRMFLSVKHATNAGGAVAARDSGGEKERQNIAVLNKKWPGVFRINGRRKGAADSEVTLNWGSYKPTGAGGEAKAAGSTSSGAENSGNAKRVKRAGA